MSDKENYSAGAGEGISSLTPLGNCCFYSLFSMNSGVSCVCGVCGVAWRSHTHSDLPGGDKSL